MQEKKTQRELADQANTLLKAAGYTRSGSKRGSGNYQQFAFERRMVKTGFRGASRPNR